MRSMKRNMKTIKAPKYNKDKAPKYNKDETIKVEQAGEHHVNTDGNFFNMVLAGISAPKRAFPQFIKTSESEFYLRKFRRDMTKATKVHLSENFMRAAVELSYAYPKYLSRLMSQSTPPLDNIWIEWNEGTRYDMTKEYLKKMGKLVSDTDTNRSDTGYLIRQHGMGHEYSLVFPEGASNKLMFPALSWFFSNNPDNPFSLSEMNKLRLAQGYPPVDEETDRKNRGEHLLYLLGDDYRKVHFPEVWDFNNLNDLVADKKDWNKNKHASDHVEFVMPWMMHTQKGLHDLSFSLYPNVYSNNEDDTLWKNSNECHKGDLRFLTAVFSLLNYPRIIKERVNPPKKVPSLRWGRRVPRNEVKVIEVELPKKRGVTMYEQLFTGHGSPKRQHMRRGHPRRYRDVHGRISKEVWIEPMVVGNPELGVIEHEYFLKTKGDKYEKSK